MRSVRHVNLHMWSKRCCSRLRNRQGCYVKVGYEVKGKEIWKIPSPHGGTAFVVGERETSRPWKHYYASIPNLLSRNRAIQFVACTLSHVGIQNSSVREIVGPLSDYAISQMRRAIVDRVNLCLDFVIEFVTVHWLSESGAINLALRESESVNEQRNFGAMPASMTTIVSALETVSFKKDVEGLNSNCVICLEEFLEDSNVKQMPCLHIFHGRCILNWLVKSNCCPVCRFRLQEES